MNNIHFTPRSYTDAISGFIIGCAAALFLVMALDINIDVDAAYIQERLDRLRTTCEKLDSTIERYDQSEATCKNGITFKF